ncbi:hypothetical protein K440DRAFT_635777 [Wilcoxina mikolae CBS 423.85]|nr:hypothetical protein K440DRAFT_635777 [Wilcoxina mikolae CBS 423.85]
MFTGPTHRRWIRVSFTPWLVNANRSPRVQISIAPVVSPEPDAGSNFAPYRYGGPRKRGAKRIEKATTVSTRAHKAVVDHNLTLYSPRHRIQMVHQPDGQTKILLEAPRLWLGLARQPCQKAILRRGRGVARYQRRRRRRDRHLGHSRLECNKLPKSQHYALEPHGITVRSDSTMVPSDSTPNYPGCHTQCTTGKYSAPWQPKCVHPL